MDKKTNLADCLRGDNAPCACACPFNLDIRQFIEKLKLGSFDAAYKLYRNAVVFPGIVSRLCPAPCRNRCVLRSIEPINLPQLERASEALARSLDPIDFNVPPKQKSIAIVGGGLSGLACALRLASKRYQVILYEKSSRVGGSIYSQLDKETVKTEIERQFKFIKYDLRLNTEIHSLDEISADAVYIATGAGSENFGLHNDVDPHTQETIKPGVFMGGALLGDEAVNAIAAGIRAARYLERYLMIGRMLRDSGETAQAPQTRLRDEIFSFKASPSQKPADGDSYSRTEAKQEASRCLKCDCDACMRHCDLMDFFHCDPLKLKENVESTLMNTSLSDGNYKRLICACNQCGGCVDSCPEGIDIGEFLLEARRALHREKIMPLAWTDFLIRDMEHANGDEASIFRPAPGYAKSGTAPDGTTTGAATEGRQNKYAFFPGCQLGASDPRYVTEAYSWILSHEPETALMLCCCGAPAAWSGREGQHTQWIEQLRSEWEKLDKPELLLACPNCQKQLSVYLPEAVCRSVYEIMAPWSTLNEANGRSFQSTPQTAKSAGAPVSVFDPCASRQMPEMQKSVRDLLKSAGCELVELPVSGSEARCCGWGGAASGASPQYTAKVSAARIAMSETPYICYCTNCRDSFAALQKPAQHVFDLLFGLGGEKRPAPLNNSRRENRVLLKRTLLAEHWNEKREADENMKINMTAELAECLEKELILEDDLCQVISFCETSGRKLIDTKSGRNIGHLVRGPVTYWVEYEPMEDGWRVLDAYSHRLVVQEQEK